MKNLLLLILIQISFSPYGNCSFSEWSNQTKNGNTILNFGGNGIEIITSKRTIENVKRWYFKKNHIIGEIQSNETEKIKYFVLDEKKGNLFTFRKKSNWDNYIKKQNLIPKLYTRWFTDDWDIYNNGFFSFYLMIFPISLPLTFLYLFILYRALKKEKFKLKKPYTLVFLVFTLIILLDIIMSKFPQSI